MLIARQRLAKHIFAEANARNNRASVARARLGIYASSTTEAMFAVWSVPRGCKRTQSEDATE
jgi:hypothetical protein